MRKQTKVVIATALLALGASFTSMAAAKTGTWVLEDDGWYCYDADGDAYEDEFCLSYGKEFYMGEDGLMVTSSWVENDGKYYYVGSDGSKTINDWRFVAPEDDEEADEEWFYFNGKGQRVAGKKVIDGKTYYFEEDGTMLTGWVKYADSTATEADEMKKDSGIVYCDENGVRVSSAWVYTWEPGTDEDEAEEDDKAWYWIQSKGAPKFGKASDINGETYLFGTDAKMLEGWVIASGSDYAEINGDDAQSISGEKVYYCGTEDQGYVKKNRWVKTWAPENWDDADSDKDQYWYWIAKNGEVYAPAETTGSNAEDVTFVDGEASDPFKSEEGYELFFKELNDKWYAFNEEGQMWSGLARQNGKMFYFGGSNDGAMKTGSVMIEDEEGYEYKFFFSEGTKKNGMMEGAAVTGAANKYLYENGLLVTSGDAKYAVKPVNGKTYIVNVNGSIQTSAKVYKEDGDVIVNAKNATFNTSSDAGLVKGSVVDATKLTYTE